MFYCAMNCELSRHEPFVGRMASKRISLAPQDFMQQTVARCLCQPRPMPISLPPDAYVTLARCLCHHLRHAYVAEVRCLCRQSDIGISPAPHQKRPVYRCSGRPFFVLFGHFRHEMRIFPASEGVFRGGRRVAVAVGEWSGRTASPCGRGWQADGSLRYLHTGSALCTRGISRPQVGSCQPYWLPSPLRQDKNPIMGRILAGCNNLFLETMEE